MYLLVTINYTIDHFPYNILVILISDFLKVFPLHTFVKDRTWEGGVEGEEGGGQFLTALNPCLYNCPPNHLTLKPH